MSLETVARRYASALADVAGERGEADEVSKELLGWEEMMEANAQLKEVFGNPTVPYDQKKSVLKQLLAKAKVRPTTANFLQVLLQNQRLTELAAVNRRLSQVLDERAGVVAAQVVTAGAISERTKKALIEKLTALTRKTVRLSFVTDEGIIGGLITRIGSTVYDGSVQTQLELLRKRLVRT